MNSAVSARKVGAAQDPLDAFAYFYDPADVAQAARDWPADIRLAVCLDAEGTCEFVLFHEDESDTVLARIARVLGRPLGGFETNPAVDGFPERSLLFSQESALLRILTRDADLLERAVDYDLNFRFARDEGLDPEEVCADVDPSSHGSRSLSARRSVRKIFPLAERRSPVPPTPTSPPKGYRPPQPAEPERPAPPAPPAPPVELRATLRRVGERVRLETETSNGVPTLLRDVMLRDDLGSIHISAAALGSTDLRFTAIDMPAELFPADFVTEMPRPARVALLQSGLFVTPSKPLGFPLPDRARAVTRRLGHGLRVPFLAAMSLVATGFLSAMVAHTVSEGAEGSLWSGRAPGLDVFSAQQTR